jgi:hypothetical protein
MQMLRAGWPAHPRPSPHRRRPLDRGRRQPQGGRRPSRAYLGELHPGPLRPPVPRVRCRPPRPAGRHLLGRPARPGRRCRRAVSGALTAPAQPRNAPSAAGTRPIILTSMALLAGERITRGWPPSSRFRWACCSVSHDCGCLQAADRPAWSEP